MLFSDNGVKFNMICTLKVHDEGKGGYETTTKILKKIKGVSYILDTQEGNQGVIHISGKLDPQKFLKMISKHRSKVEIIWMKSGERYGVCNNYVMDHSMPMSAYPTPYSYFPAPPVPYYDDQYHNSATYPYYY